MASHNLSANLIKLLLQSNKVSQIEQKEKVFMAPVGLVFQKEQLTLFLLDQKIVILTVPTVVLLQLGNLIPAAIQ